MSSPSPSLPLSFFSEKGHQLHELIEDFINEAKNGWLLKFSDDHQHSTSSNMNWSRAGRAVRHGWRNLWPELGTSSDVRRTGEVYVRMYTSTLFSLRSTMTVVTWAHLGHHLGISDRASFRVYKSPTCRSSAPIFH